MERKNLQTIIKCQTVKGKPPCLTREIKSPVSSSGPGTALTTVYLPEGLCSSFQTRLPHCPCHSSPGHLHSLPLTQSFSSFLYLPGPFPGLLASPSKSCLPLSPFRDVSASTLLTVILTAVFSSPTTGANSSVNAVHPSASGCPTEAWNSMASFLSLLGLGRNTWEAVPVGDISGTSAGDWDGIPLDTPVQKPQQFSTGSWTETLLPPSQRLKFKIKLGFRPKHSSS